jgi:hypothetical protein
MVSAQHEHGRKRIASRSFQWLDAIVAAAVANLGFATGRLSRRRPWMAAAA